MITIFTILIILLVMATTIVIVDAYPKYKHYRLTYRLLENGAYRFFHRNRDRVIYRPVYRTYITEKDKEYNLTNTEIVQHLNAHNKCEFICLFHHLFGGQMNLTILYRPQNIEWLDLYSVYGFATKSLFSSPTSSA